MNQLIITADDYGMCESVNDAIEECLAAGSLRAACVMVNMPASRATTSLRHRFPQSSIGIHWNLTQGSPSLSSSQVPSLVDTDGKFISGVQFRHRWLRRRINSTDLKAELRAQYQRFYEMAGVPDFWCTHQNFHVLPGLFWLCVRMGQELQIPAMRCHRRFTIPRDKTAAGYNLRHPLYWLKGCIIDRWSKKVAGAGVLMPDRRIYTPGYSIGYAAFDEIIKRIPWSTVRRAVEMVIHPAARVEKELFGDLTESRVLEYNLLKDPGLVKRLNRSGIEPVGFEVLRYKV